MTTKRKPRGYWTEERIKELASQYDSKKEFLIRKLFCSTGSLPSRDNGGCVQPYD